MVKQRGLGEINQKELT